MRRDITRDASLTVTRAQVSVGLWQAARTASRASAARLERSRKAYALGETDLAELLLAERLDGETALAERRARVDAHEALLLVRIDGHDLWHGE